MTARDNPEGVSASGTIEQVSVSDGGVPKLPVLMARVTTDGVEGDRQQNLKFHGGPQRAVCLWAAERIESLAAEGHPIGFGCAGENVTLRGIPWNEVVPGRRLKLGSEAEIEITSYAVPCAANARWFSDGKLHRIHQETHPGWSRTYAKVLKEGVIQPGDEALLLDTVD